ncbi:hypothetical protein B0T20DRAFT_346579 [Sordaria brevicollis]|uniref:Uncharacterized protein n=1 Tax=Sordaria brevicollis TaxID=83679 RepID=A0AAE0PKE8_SORBR|nr:hypothetical protein B0T20DRAFT_346579 [Sordaria brevicollis]
MSTIFLGGDSAKPKTASSGYAAQIDIINDIWGFCPTSAPVQKCGLPGSCVDSHACSKGCGFTDDSSLPTITWYSSSTAALTSSTRGPTPSSAPTTKPAVSTTSPPNTSSVSEPTASASSSATGSNGDINSNNDIDINSGNTNNTNSSNSNTFNINNPNTIGAIIGGVVGCLALICIAVVLVIWLRRRYRKEKNESDPKPTSKSSSSSSSSSSSTFPFSPNPSIKDMIDQTGGDYTFPRDGAKEVEALPPKYPIPAAVHVSSREVKYPPVYEVENREYRRGGWIPSSGPRELPGGRSPKEMENNWLQNMPVELPAGSVYWKGQHPREGVPF